MSKLYITDIGTIKCDNGNSLMRNDFEEMPYDKFLKELRKDVTKTYSYYDPKSSFYINAPKYVIKNDEENYTIATSYVTLYNFCIADCKEYYPIVKKELDELAEISEKTLTEREIVANFEDNNSKNDSSSISDGKIYLNYLKKHLNKINLTKVGIIGPLVLMLSGLFYGNVIDSTPLLAGSFAPFISYMIILGAQYDTFLNLFKESKIIKFKIKKMEKKLSKMLDVKMKIDSEGNAIEIKRDLYKDSIINYMQTIVDGTTKLNNQDRRIKLLELREILDEYLTKTQELAKREGGLTLDDNARMIAVSTLDKLTTLEMEIAEILRRDNEKNKSLAEGEDLMKEIDKYLDIVDTDEADLSTYKGDKKKVRTLQTK